MSVQGYLGKWRLRGVKRPPQKGSNGGQPQGAPASANTGALLFFEHPPGGQSLAVNRRKTRTPPEHLRAKHPSRRHRQFLARASRSLRRRAALSIRMNAPISLKPSESEMKSSIWAIDNALPEPCGANAFGAPSKKNSIGTCRIWDICCNRLAPMRFAEVSSVAEPRAVGAARR